MEESHENDIKVILLGDCGVGKTNIISRYISDVFRDSVMSTNGANYGMKKVEVDGVTYDINIWDTAGQEKYRAVTKMFIQDSQIVLICYSIIDRSSFNNLEYWVRLALDMLDGDRIVLGVIGNKADLFEIEKVKEKEGETFAKKHKALFHLASAKTNKKGIDKLFYDSIKKYLKIKKGDTTSNSSDNQSIKLNEKSKSKIEQKKTNCC